LSLEAIRKRLLPCQESAALAGVYAIGHRALGEFHRIGYFEVPILQCCRRLKRVQGVVIRRNSRIVQSGTTGVARIARSLQARLVRRALIHAWYCGGQGGGGEACRWLALTPLTPTLSKSGLPGFWSPSRERKNCWMVHSLATRGKGSLSWIAPGSPSGLPFSLASFGPFRYSV
jgi:hypothetical protein